MLSEKDKNITAIAYNFLNLPNQVTQTTATTSYVYSAAGLKLKKTYQENCSLCGSSPLIIDYLDGFQYNTTFGSAVLQFIPTSEGYYDFIKKSYIYNYTDHLGNVRLSYYKNNAGVLTIVEENNYYPFGLKHEGYNEAPTAIAGYNYKYNGKELQETGMYDYGQRHYMPDIGRFNRPDRFSEKYFDLSSYSYVANNPVRYIDVKGDSIRLSLTIDYSMTANPNGLSDLGVTNYSNGNLTGVSNSNVNIDIPVDIHLSASFKGTSSSTNIETQNPGLEREVVAHEKSHKDQIMDAAKSPISINVTLDGKSQSYTGPPDKVILDAAKAFVGSTDASKMNKADKQNFTTNNIVNPALNEMGNNMSKVATDPNKETDANNRAASALGSSTIKYNNGKTPVVYNGKTLK